MQHKLFEKHRLLSFDKNYSAEVYLKNPDKYRQLEEDSLKFENLISRGGGYSYVAASFKKESLSLCMKNFNRILDFSPKEKTITVEAGITILEFLNFTLKSGLWIPQSPGYPFISVGGAVASNVHGKSAGTHGTIKNAIKEILIFHKKNGWIKISNEENKNIFDLTIGGYGLTGTIVSVKFKLTELQNASFETSTTKVNSLTETINLIKNNKDGNSFIYSWNTVCAKKINFGDGLIFCNKMNEKNEKKIINLTKIKEPKFYNNLFYFCLWNKLSVKSFNYFFFKYYDILRKKNYNDTFSNVIFPYFGKESYFSMFGKKGFFESQILISYEKVEEFIEEFKNLNNKHNPTITLFSIKGMSGEHKYLRFEGNMICIALDIVKNQKNLSFMKDLDKLYIKYEAIPYIIKDSRLNKEVFDKCYKYADQFRKELKSFDQQRYYRSELSDRLGL